MEIEEKNEEQILKELEEALPELEEQIKQLEEAQKVRPEVLDEVITI